MERIANTKNNYQTLKSLYESSITVDSIAEAVVVCNLDDDSFSIKKEMDDRNYDVLGVKDGNDILGYVERKDLESSSIRQALKRFDMKDIITNSTPLIQFLHIFKGRSRIFVLEKNRVTKLITSADLQKPPIRILIFGYITLLEMNLGELINWKFGEHGWKPFLSEARLKKAESLYLNRQARNEDLSLIECLQISDKLQILSNDRKLFEQFNIPSKSKWKTISKNITELRDKIAHSNELGINHQWEEIIHVIEISEQLLEVSEELLADTDG